MSDMGMGREARDTDVRCEEMGSQRHEKESTEQREQREMRERRLLRTGFR